MTQSAPVRLIAVCMALIIGLLAVHFVRGQDVQPSPLWRTLLVSNATPAVGEETELYFEVGNESPAHAWLGGVVCSIQKRDSDGAWIYSTDLRPISVTDQNGYPVLFFWGDGPLYIVTSIPTNLLPSEGRRSFRVQLKVVGNTRSENLITCGLEYAAQGRGGHLSDSLYVAVWQFLPEVTPDPGPGNADS
jgi:hypothetical protein